MGSDKKGGPSAPDDLHQGCVTQAWLATSDDEIDWRVFLSSTPSCAESDRGRPQDSGRIAGRVRPHLWHTSRLTSALRAPAGQDLRGGEGAGVALSDAIEPCSRVAPTRRPTFPSVSLKSREAALARTCPAATRTPIAIFPEPRLGAATTRTPTSSRDLQSRGAIFITGAAPTARPKSCTPARVPRRSGKQCCAALAGPAS
jgi:hypothetical protein